MLAGASGKSTITTVAVTSPVDFSLSSIRGQPPIDTSPRPSATGNLQSVILVGADAGVGFEPATTFIPLFQTNFFPDLMQVKVFAPTTDLLPTFVHLAPALAAAVAGIRRVDKERESIDKNTITLLFTYIA
jgi:hypothetical protein